MKKSLLFGAVLAASFSAVHAAPLATLDHQGAWVSVEAYGANVLRVTIATDKEQALRAPGYGLLPAAAETGGFKHSGGAAGDDFTSAAMSLHVTPIPKPHTPAITEAYFSPLTPPIGLQVKNAKGEMLLDMTGWSMAPHIVTGEHTFQVGASFLAPEDEHYYGMGQNQESRGPLDLRGRAVDCKHWYDAPGGETVCIPFLVSSKGYAILWDNPSDTHLSAGINGSTSFSSEVGERVSFFVIVGDKPAEIYGAYARLTGKTPIPPKAAFGLIQSKARYDSQDEILRVAHTYRQKGYPLDVMVLDWFYWTKMGQLDINPAEFPDADAMNKELHGLGMRSIVSIWPRFENTGRYYKELESKGYFLKDKDGKTVDGLPFRADRAGALIDSTNPKARKWYWEHARDNVLSHGFDYPWLDETEPDLVPDGYFYSIGSGDRYHDVFPLLHVEGVSQGLRAWRPSQRPLILARAAYLGSQRTGALFWSSDISPTWEALQRQIPTGLNMTASGIAYWGNDIGGWQWLPQTTSYKGTPLVSPEGARETIGQNNDYPELLTRWFEYGTFLPTLRLHGDRKHTEIFAFGPEAEAIMARYDRLRYQLIPYLYSQAKATYDSGVPFMRALWMDFPKDPNVADLGTEYLLGPDFLVAPVTKPGQTEKAVYLPAGADWYDYWTEEKKAGGQWVTVAAPIDHIPLFVRAGSILPLGSDIQSTTEKQKIAAIKIYPGTDASFALYDDDGQSLDYEKGKSEVKAVLHWDDKAKKLTSSGSSDPFAKPVSDLAKVIGK